MKRAIAQFFATFLKGLVALLPIFLSVYVVIWLLLKVEQFTDGILSWFWPASAQVPGLGIVMGILVIFSVGVLLEEPHIKGLLRKLEAPFKLMPLVKTVYSAVKDLMSFLAPKEKNSKSNVVVVEWPGIKAQSVGLVTRGDLTDLPAAIEGHNKVAVYFPMSYQLGGYTLFVPKDWIKPVNMDVETAIKLSLTAWVKAKPEGQ